MDRTHLRWFTPASFRAVFEEAGVEIEKIGPVAPPGWKAALAGRLTGGTFAHLLIRQINLIGRRGPERASDLRHR